MKVKMIKNEKRNPRGLVSVFSEYLSDTIYYIYDIVGRDSIETSSTGSVTHYTYGNRTTTTETDGKSFTKTFDAWGNVKTSTDPVSSVSYSYSSVGKPSAITCNSNTVRIYYDRKGARTKIVDPDAGSTEFTYDALGRVVTKTDPRGQVTWTYDAFGRPLTKNEYGGTTIYTYGTQDVECLRLMSENSGGYISSYTYDRLGRVTSEKREMREGEELTCSMSYNSQGLPGSKTYPNGISLSYAYDQFGYRTNVHKGNQCVWRLDYFDGRKRREYLCSDSIRNTAIFDRYGNPKSSSTYCLGQMVDTMTYLFDPLTGNMLMRKDASQTHTFTYDNLDRLTSAVYSPQDIQSMTYSSDGNILSKTGIGSYSYGTTKPHAVISVDNTGGVISGSDQSVYYTGFGKADVITENGRSLYITYGPNHQRWRAKQYDSSHALERTTYYFDDYEMAVTPNASYEYIHLDGGLVYIRSFGNGGRFCYRCTDNLGSVRGIVTADGQQRFSASYDAWGKQTVALNTVDYRCGYTGHEMLPEFGLVNMNGRLYDPDLGRFLSPDDYVQVPDLSQSFNRYSYCLNNPLKYTDPSGESFLWDDVIVGAIGFATGYLTNSVSSGNWGWKSVMGGLSSAVTSLLAYNTSGVSATALNSQFWGAAAQIGANNILSSVLPSKTFQATDHFSLSISPLIGIGPMGFSLGASYSFGFHYDDWSFGFGVGGGNGYIGFNTNIYNSSVNFGVGYGRTAYEECMFNGNVIDAQTVGTISMFGKGWSFSLSNDYFGDGEDRGRTNAAELNIGNFVIGTNILTNNGNEASNNMSDGIEKGFYTHLFKREKLKKGSWPNGKVYHAPFWLGYRNGNTIHRFGYSHKIVQDATQNFVHKFMNTPFFLIKNNDPFFTQGFYSYIGNYNPYNYW